MYLHSPHSITNPYYTKVGRSHSLPLRCLWSLLNYLLFMVVHTSLIYWRGRFFCLPVLRVTSGLPSMRISRAFLLWHLP